MIMKIFAYATTVGSPYLTYTYSYYPLSTRLTVGL